MNNPMLTALMQMRRQGSTPEAAVQQMARMFPQFQQIAPMMQGKTPAEMDAAAKNVVRSMGFDPGDMIARMMGKK